jgi:hypothetical protein
MLSLLQGPFLQIGLDERTPDHVTISRTRRLTDDATHQEVTKTVAANHLDGDLSARFRSVPDLEPREWYGPDIPHPTENDAGPPASTADMHRLLKGKNRDTSISPGDRTGIARR